MVGHWFVYLPSREPVCRLFCIPHAGAGSAAFAAWWNSVPVGLEVGIVRLPGRENRLKEPLFSEMNTLIDALAGAILPELTLPFALFGHCSGALIAFELAHAVIELGGRLPEAIFVSGQKAPQLIRPTPRAEHMNTEDLLTRVREMGGIEQAILQHPGLREILLRVLRADLTLADNYRYDPKPPIDCPIVALVGEADNIVAQDGLRAWAQQTTAGFETLSIPGDHFSVLKDVRAVLSHVADRVGVLPAS